MHDYEELLLSGAQPFEHEISQSNSYEAQLLHPNPPQLATRPPLQLPVYRAPCHRPNLMRELDAFLQPVRPLEVPALPQPSNVIGSNRPNNLVSQNRRNQSLISLTIDEAHQIALNNSK